jgi:fructokinase
MAASSDEIHWDVLGCGAVLIDRIEYRRDDLPPRRFVQWGGPAGNALALLSTFGLRTALIGAIGEDAHEGLVREAMKEFGVDDCLLVVRPREHTPAIDIRIDVAGHAGREPERIGCRGARPRSGRARLPRKALGAEHVDAVARCRLVHFDLAGAASVALARAARERGIPVSLDLPRFHKGRERDVVRMVHLCDLLFTNESSARKHLEVLGVGEFLEANPSIRLAVVTHGSKGAEARTGGSGGDRRLWVDAVEPTRFHDSLGAGDAFIAGVLRAVLLEDLLSKLNTDALDIALRDAAGLASRACEHAGAKGLAAREKATAKAQKGSTSR